MSKEKITTDQIIRIFIRKYLYKEYYVTDKERAELQNFEKALKNFIKEVINK